MALQEEFEKQGNWLFKYRSYIPLIGLLLAFLLYLRKESYSGTVNLEEIPFGIHYEEFCLFLSLLGFFVRAYTVGHTPKSTSGRNTKEGQLANTINTTGMYSIVRHPLYIGNFLMWLGLAMLTANFWFIVSFGLLFWIYYERIMFAEEQFLRRKFEVHYLKWSSNVPAFIPKIKLFKKSAIPFSWKKVLRNEKNGLFALFLLFTFFDISGNLLKDTTDYDYFLMVMNILTGVGYLILKYLKKKTTLLDE